MLLNVFRKHPILSMEMLTWIDNLKAGLGYLPEKFLLTKTIGTSRKRISKPKQKNHKTVVKFGFLSRNHYKCLLFTRNRCF